MNSILKIAAVAVIGLATWVVPAAAGTVNGTCSTDTGTTDRGNFNTSTTVSIACSKFDSDLGPLTSMVLTVTGSIAGPLTLTNNANQPQTFTFQANFNYFINNLSGFSLLSPAFAPSFSTGSITLLANGGTTSYNLALNGNTGPLTNTTNFAPYQSSGGVGTFPIDFLTATATTFFGGGGNIGLEQTTIATTTATVVYNYGIQTPEPASMALLGGGLVGMGLLRRRRK